jgi:acetate kinase
MSPLYRHKILENLKPLGVDIDSQKNDISVSRNGETRISTDASPVKIFVIPTDEELVMTEDAFALMNGSYDVHTNFTYSF